MQIKESIESRVEHTRKSSNREPRSSFGQQSNTQMSCARDSTPFLQTQTQTFEMCWNEIYGFSKNECCL